MNALPYFTAIAALAATLATTGPATAADKVVLGQQPSTLAAVASAGIAKGYFTEQGIEFDSRWATRGLEIIQALGAGQADLGIAAVTPVIAARAKGLPIIIVGLQSYGFPGYFVAGKKNAQATRLEDFKGKRIGVPVGTGVHTVLLMAIEKSGLKQSDFQIQNARVNDLPAAMQSDGFDAVLGWIPFTNRVVAMGNGKVVMTPTQFEESVGITYPMVLVAMEDTIRKRPDVLQRFMFAWARSMKFVHTERAETVRMLRQAVGDRIKGFDDKTLGEMLYGKRHDRVALSEADVADVRRMGDFMLAHKDIEAKPDIATLINNSFARKAEGMMK